MDLVNVMPSGEYPNALVPFEGVGFFVCINKLNASASFMPEK
jgi:hypothetical protein